MAERSTKEPGAGPASQRAVIERLSSALEDGADWATSLVEAIALWTTPEESYRGRRYNYFIQGEAFDWMLLAERLFGEVGGLVTQKEREDFLFSGRFPDTFDTSKLADLLGVEKYRGYLNYYYGVIVEEALQLATELEVHKRHTSNSVSYREDYTEEAYVKVYGTPGSRLLAMFREEKGSPARRSISVGESREFTYWLFKYRLKASDSAKIASDTKKGLEQLQRMREASGLSVGTHGPPFTGQVDPVHRSASPARTT